MSAEFDKAGSDKQAGSAWHAGLGVRASDAERDAAAAELREHYAAGRLTIDELNDRISQAFAAKTRGDLSATMHDLPSLRPGGTPLPVGAPPVQSATGAGWTGQDWGRGHGWHPGSGDAGPGGGTGPGSRGPWGPGHAIGAIISAAFALCMLAGLGILAMGGGGSGRFGIIAVLLAAFALLRRLFFRHARRVKRVRTRRGPRGPHRRR